MTWISDDKGNRCSVELWGSEENARKALATNEDCSGCSDCSGCHACGGCGQGSQLIYRESGCPINPSRFFDSNKDALADMKALAEAEAVR